MQLVSMQQKTVNTLDPANTEQLKIKVNAKAFTVLMDKMYSNKIRAVIRELSTNAYEAHQLLKKESTPFLVNLPSHWDNNFSIRDYGPGLSHHDVMNLYTTFFDSTKDNSNEFGGAFGLGSKSPFAYCDNYIVISIHCGKKSTYILAKNDEGIPTCSLMHSEDSDEPTGLEIKIAVNKYDVGHFSTEASFVYRFFKTRPIIKGATLTIPPEKVVVKGDGWETVDSYDSFAIMGNVAYSLSNYTGQFKEIINIPGMRLIFNIGEIEPQPNREGLSFNQNTIKSIEKKLAKIKESVEDLVKKDVEKQNCWWDAVIAYRPAKAKYAFIKVDYKGRNLDNTFYPKKIVVEDDPYNPGKKRNVNVDLVFSYQERRYGTRVFTTSGINPQEEVVFIVEDKCSYLRQRIKKYLEESSNARKAFLIPVDDQKGHVELFGITEDRLILASSLPKPEINKSTTSNRHKSKVLKFDKKCQSVYAGSYWKDDEVDLENDSGFYIGIYNNKILYKDQEISPDKLESLLNFMSIKDDIFGVKKAHLGKVTSPNMQNLELEIEKFFKTNTILMEKLYNGNSDWNEIKHHSLVRIIKLNSKIAKYFGGLDQDVAELEKLSNDYNKNYQMLNLFYSWNVVNNFNATQRVNKTKEKLDKYNKMYPLLQYINSSQLPNLTRDIECYLLGVNQKGNP